MKYDTASISEHYSDPTKLSITLVNGEAETTIAVNKKYSTVYNLLKKHMHKVSAGTVQCNMPLSIWTDNFYNYYLRGE